MATTNAMFTITDTGDLSGRNLALDSGAERSGTVPSSREYVYLSIYNVSDFGKSFVHTQNQQLTISCEYEVTGNSLDTAYIYFQLNGSQTNPVNTCYVLDNPTGVYHSTFTVTSGQSTSTNNYIRARLHKASPGSTITIKNVKLEVGKAATDWTPAPEDVVTAMETAESKNSVYYQTSAPTGKKVGDTWFDTNDGNKIYRWNGSSWVAAELGDSAVANLSASKLIAGSVMGNVILGGTIQAGGSDVGQDGKVLVKDVNDNEVASLSKDGLIATAGSVGGWGISEDGLVRTEVVSENVTRTSKFGCWSDSTINGGCELRLLQKDPEDDDHVYSDSRIIYGVGNAAPNMHIYDEKYNSSEDTNSIYECFVNASSIFLYLDKISQSADEVISSAHTEYGIYGPDVHGVGNIAHWSVLSPTRTVKGTLKVAIYRCGNLFWAHFFGSIPAGWNGAQNAYLPIVSNDDDGYPNSIKCAPPERIEKYIQPQNPSNARPIIRVNADGTIGLYSIIKSVDNTNWTTVADNMETCDIFWARIG